MNQNKDPFRMVPVNEFESYVRDLKQNDNYGFHQQFKVQFCLEIWYYNNIYIYIINFALIMQYFN